MAPKLTELPEMGHETDENVIYERAGFILCFSLFKSQ